jgi:HPt (histidine-containing phosphotransfer) domain-containing protein/HAMP domain-containing protein
VNDTHAKRRIFIPLGTRLTVPVVLLVAAVAFGAYLGITRASRLTAMRSKEVAADMVGRLTALSIMPAVVFGDEIEIKRAVDDLAKNPEITDVELWATESAPEGAPSQALASFHRAGGRALGKPRTLERVRRLESDSVSVFEPVIGADKKTVAVLSLRFSTDREAQAVAALTRQILFVSAGMALCLAAALLFVMTRLVVSPIRRLTRAAQRLGSGGSKAELADVAATSRRSDDEVTQLAVSFQEMATAVQDREQKLSLRNGELRLILDSVDQGFLTALPSGLLLPERSRVVGDWLGAVPEELRYWDLVGVFEPASQAWAEMAWSQVVDGILPLEVAIDQLPKRLVRDGRHFDLAYHPVLAGESLERMVIVLTDVTAEMERQRALADQHEFSVLVDQFVRDRRAFMDFWSEASDLVRRIVDRNGNDALRRDVHTLKGNARFFGLSRLSALCHSLEDAMQERGENSLTEVERVRLHDVWESLRVRIEPLMSGATSFLEISEDEYQRLVEAVRSRVSFERIEEVVHGLRHEPTAWRLGRAKETLLLACKRLGKSAPEVVVDHHDLRLPPGRWAPFWSVFQHLLNNAADHGLEPDEERLALGKPVPGKVVLATSVVGKEFVVEIRDDGRGIDWSRVQKLATERGLPTRDQRDLEQALLTEGFSLKERVSETSGRGVGLAAVRTVVNAMGGRLEIETAKGQGTAWCFRFPIGKLEAASAVSKREVTQRASNPGE